MTPLLLSTVLGAVGITGQIIASRNAVVGWSISIAAQPLWVLFYLSVGGYGLLPLSTGYLIAAVLNLRTALRHRRDHHTARSRSYQPAPGRPHGHRWRRAGDR